MKDKRHDEMKQTIKQLRNAMAINDWNVVSDEFANINKQLTKAAALVAEEGVPTYYIACIVKIAELVEQTAADKEKVKKMSKTNAKSLNAMKQNIKKNNETYKVQIAKYLENPEAEEDQQSESGSESDSESDSGSGSGSDSEDEDKEGKKAKAKDSKPKAAGSDDDEDSDDSEWPSDSTSSSSSDDDGSAPMGRGISKWMKTGDGSDSDSDEGFEKVAKKKDKGPRVQGPGKKKVGDDAPKEAKEEVKMVLNEENVMKKLDELMAQRGRRGTSKKDQIAQLELLSTAQIPPVMSAMVLVHLIAAQFDTSMTRNNVNHMPISFEIVEEGTGMSKSSRENCLWTKCMHNVRKLLQVLRENPELTEEATGQQSATTTSMQGAPPNDAVEMMDADDEPLIVAQNLVSFVERLDDELYLSLRLLDSHSAEFLKRLLDIAPLLSLAKEVQEYYEKISNHQVAARLAMRRLEHLYYKHDDLIARASLKCEQPGDCAVNREEYIKELAMKVYRYGDDALRTRAMLCQIYYHALHDRFYQARDMLLMSHLQDNIHHTNSIPVQILFNRVMAQIGLSAFRNGLVLEAHACFDELCGNNRLKELLAQVTTSMSRLVYLLVQARKLRGLMSGFAAEVPQERCALCVESDHLERACARVKNPGPARDVCACFTGAFIPAFLRAIAGARAHGEEAADALPHARQPRAH
jgi:translation initiation factor 3 subunit C